MTKINQIEQAIIALSPGAFQKLMDEYLVSKYHFDNITPYGSHTGTNKTTLGTPDSYVCCTNGKRILIQHGSVGKAFSKVKDDLLDCLNPQKTGVPLDQIEQIICCHTSTNFSAGQIAELESLFDNITIIGLGDVSYDLLNKYPLLALDHLGVALDTHQFFDWNGFLKEYEKNAYSTSLNMPLLCREDDLEKLTGLIASANVVMLYGASGIGKTRLAIEAAKQYTNAHNAKLLILKGNGETIINDCSFYIDGERENVIVIDDANNLQQIQHLLRMAEDKDRPHALRLLLTVRDYMRKDLSKRVDEISKPKTLELKPLSNNSIAKILKDIFSIENHELIHHIQSIAKGNARLAIMAAKCVAAENFDAIKNAFELFDGYYSPIVSRLDQDEITVAFLIAFFDAIMLDESTLAVKIAQDKGISYGNFCNHCKRLHQAEVVNLLDNRAVRFDNQNLRDYLLYYCLIQQKIITPSALIAYAFPKYNRRIVFAFNTLLKIFQTDESAEYLKQEVGKAWHTVKQYDDQAVLSFVQSFSSMIPDETLLFVKKQIEALPEVHPDIDLSNIPKNSGFRSPLLEILAQFNASDLFEEAMALVFRYLERNSESLGDFCLLFSEAWGINYRSYMLDFSKTLKVIEQLLMHYQKYPSDRYAICLYSFISKNYECNFSDAIPNDNDSITFVNFKLPATETVCQIRKHCILSLAELLHNPKHQQLADKVLSELHRRCIACDEQIIHSDVQTIAHVFSHLLHSDNYVYCFYLRQIHLVCEEADIPYPGSLEKYNSNRVFSLFCVLSENYISKYHKLEDYREIEASHYRDIIKLCNTTSQEEFAMLWEALSSPPLNNGKFSYDIGRSINLVFQYLQYDWERFITCAEGYIKAGAPFGFSCGSLMDALINKWGYEESERYIRSYSFGYKYRWIADIHNQIHEEEMNQAACDRIMLLRSQPDDTFAPVCYETALKAERVCPGFMAQYLCILNQKAAKRPYELSSFLRPLTARNHAEPKELIHILKDSIETLLDSYLMALKGQQHFDSDGYLLLALITHSKQARSLVVSNLLADGQDCFGVSTLSVLWNSDNYMELATEIVDTLRTIDRNSYYSLGKELIRKPLNSSNKRDSVVKWIVFYITKYCKDVERMKYLFQILGNCRKEILKQALLCFCKNNSNYHDFASLRLGITPQGGWGSEIPRIDDWLSFLESLKQELRGIDFIEHRAYISSTIQSIRAYKSRIEAEEFVEHM